MARRKKKTSVTKAIAALRLAERALKAAAKKKPARRKKRKATKRRATKRKTAKRRVKRRTTAKRRTVRKTKRKSCPTSRNVLRAVMKKAQRLQKRGSSRSSALKKAWASRG